MFLEIDGQLGYINCHFNSYVCRAKEKGSLFHIAMILKCITFNQTAYSDEFVFWELQQSLEKKRVLLIYDNNKA